METSPVNLGSDSESNYIEDRSGPEEKKDLETIQYEENENSKELDDLSACDAVPIGKDKKGSSENPKNMELIQKSSDALNQLLDNMSNLKVNSTMETKESGSSEALKPETNTENVKSALNTEDSGAAPTNVIVQKDLSPVRFHRVHGEYIKMSDDYCTARPDIPEIPKIQNNLCRLGEHKYMVFSSRPIAVGEKLYIRLETVPETFIDYFGFCFTNCDPNTLKYSPPFRNPSFCEWYNSLNFFSNKFVYKNYTYYFCVEPSGMVGYGMNDEHMGYLFGEVNIYSPLWAGIKLCHNVTSVSFIDSPNENETEELKPLSLEKPSPPTANALTDLGKNNQKWDVTEEETKLKPHEKADLEKNTVENEGSGSAAFGGDCATSHADVAMNVLTPLRFHRVHGQFIEISNDYCTAKIAIPENKPFVLNDECLAFSSRPVAINEEVYLRLEWIPSTFHRFVGFGFTDCDPNTLTDLKSWRCINWSRYYCSNLNDKDNIFRFCVKPSGEVCEDIEIDINVPHWAVIKLNHLVTTVKFIDSPKVNETEELKPPSIKMPLPPTTNALDEPKRQFGNINNLKLNLTTDKDKPESSKAFKPKANIENTKEPLEEEGNGTAVSNTSLKNLCDLRFHSVHGKYIKLSPDKTIAKCEMPAFVDHECYVFSSRPVDINEKVHLKFETVSKECFTNFSFGFTYCDPSIKPHDISRLCQKNIFGNHLIVLSSQYYVKDNYMHFYVNKSGEIHFGINEEEKGVCYRGVNTSSRVWAIMEVNNYLSSVRLERKKQVSCKSIFAGAVSSIDIKTSSTTKEEETGASSKNTKSDSDDESKNSPANCNVLTGKLRTEVPTNTKGQALFEWGVASTVKTKPELKIAQTSEEAFKSTLLPSKSNTPTKQIQPTSSTDVENNQESVAYDVKHFAKIVEYQLNRIPEHRRMKCMQKILEVLDTASTASK